MMKFRGGKITSTLILVVALLLLLPLLAILQYRWLSQLSEREREYMRSNLSEIATRFSQDFDNELTRTYAVLSPSPELWRDSGLPAYVARYDRWLTVAQYPRMIGDIMVAHADEKGWLHLHRLKTDTREFVPSDWPAKLSTLRLHLEECVRSEQHSFVRDLSNRLRPIDNETIAFIHPIFIPPAGGQQARMALGLPHGFVIITISLSEVQQEVFPALTKRHFSGADGYDYSGAIVTGPPEPRVIYQFGPEAIHHTQADVTVGLMGLRREEIRRIISSIQPAEMAQFPMFKFLPHPLAIAPSDFHKPPPRDMHRMPLPNEEPRLWELRLTHRAGSLEAAVVSIRRRHLLISFGILVLLSLSIALLILSARRAERLAHQQMDFVAGVSHELRTPLAVIKSAAWSLTHGVVREQEQVKRYSTLIGKESDRLIEMIEQVLEFAGARSGRQKLDLQPTGVSELIENVLASAQPLLAEAGFQIEKNIASDSLQVMADAPALSRALRNLIDNAIKYSGESRWIGVQAQAAGSGSKATVQITVSDHGSGIPNEELKYVFEPFWRGSEATAAQIHGNGLGLNLVKNIVNAHGGSISVQSAAGRGSSFTLSLPAVATLDPQPATVTSKLDRGAAS